MRVMFSIRIANELPEVQLITAKHSIRGSYLMDLTVQCLLKYGMYCLIPLFYTLLRQMRCFRCTLMSFLRLFPGGISLHRIFTHINLPRFYLQGIILCFSL